MIDIVRSSILYWSPVWSPSPRFRFVAGTASLQSSRGSLTLSVVSSFLSVHCTFYNKTRPHSIHSYNHSCFKASKWRTDQIKLDFRVWFCHQGFSLLPFLTVHSCGSFVSQIRKRDRSLSTTSAHSDSMTSRIVSRHQHLSCSHPPDPTSLTNFMFSSPYMAFVFTVLLCYHTYAVTLTTIANAPETLAPF